MKKFVKIIQDYENGGPYGAEEETNNWIVANNVTDVVSFQFIPESEHNDALFVVTYLAEEPIESE